MANTVEAERLLLRDVGTYGREVIRLEEQKVSLTKELEEIEAGIASRRRVMDEVWAIIHILRAMGKGEQP